MCKVLTAIYLYIPFRELKSVLENHFIPHLTMLTQNIVR